MKSLLQAVSLAIIFALLAMFSYPVFEPTQALAVTDNVDVTLTVDSGISITDASNTSMSPNISISNDTSTGSTAWTVITNDNAGYTLSVKATTTPAMHNGTDSFADYSEAVSGTPDAWSVDSGNYEFGYSAYGTDTPTGTWGSGGSCGSGDPGATSMNYVGFSTSDKQVASRSTVTPYAGLATTVCFGAEQNTVFAPSGVYVATIVATAVVQ
jgi:hypothetical protein